MRYRFNYKNSNAGMLKTGCLMLAFILCFSISAFSAENKEWTIGREENQNGPSDNEQGTNGWYFLYSEEMDTDGVLDTSKLKECLWSDWGSCWLYYGYEAMWMPEQYASKDYDFNKKGNWWRMDSNGIMDPNAGDDSVRSVIAWEAPESGTYSIELDYTAGTGSYEWEGKTYYAEDGDGLTLSINTEKEILEKVYCEAVSKEKPDLPSGTLLAEAELKKGERLYISADPGGNGSCDAASIKMNITQIKAAGSVTGLNRNLLLAGIGIVGVLAGILIVLVRAKKE